MAGVLAGRAEPATAMKRTATSGFILALLLLCNLCPAWAAAGAEPFDWPGLSERGLILDELSAADPYNFTTHTPHHHSHKRIGFHWVVTSCDGRNMWSRTLASTLLSALASGVHPTTITIVWCKSYSPEAETSIFGNMRLSGLIKVLYMPASMEVPNMDKSLRIRVTYLMALNVPQYYGAPELPLLQTEDDVIFAPDFNARLAEAVSKIETRTKGPYFISLYSGNAAISIDEARAKHSAKARDSFTASPDITVRRGGWSWGTQGFLFSVAAVPGLRSFFQEVLHGKHEQVGFQDMILLDFVKSFENSKAGGQGIQTYSTRPSLLEHVGAQSSLFGTEKENTRFHMATIFPFKVQLPADDPPGAW